MPPDVAVLLAVEADRSTFGRLLQLYVDGRSQFRETIRYRRCLGIVRVYRAGMRPLIGDVRLHVSVLGDEWVEGARRPVIVALHGGPGVDAGVLAALMRPAADYAQVIVPDQRGHGHSDRSKPARWDLDTWADDLAALVHQLGVDQPVVLGTSFGGFVVQHYLARHPEQPAGAVLIGTTAREADRATIIERFRHSAAN